MTGVSTGIGHGAAHAFGGSGIAIQCDHGDDQQMPALLWRVRADSRRLDILVNNAMLVHPRDLTIHHGPAYGALKAGTAMMSFAMAVVYSDSIGKPSDRFGLLAAMVA